MEIQRVGICNVRSKLAALPDVAVSYAVNSLACAQAGLVIGKGKRIAALGHGGQLSAALPVNRPAAVAQGVAYAVVSYLLAIVCGQQVAPFSVAVGVGSSRSAAADCAAAGAGVLRAAEDIAAVIVGVVPRFSRRRVLLPYQLAEIVVLICYGLVAGDGEYISVGVVGVVEVCSLAAVGVGDRLDLSGGICAVNVAVGIAGAEDGAAAVLDRRPRAAAMTVIGYLLGDIAVAECGRTAVVVIGVGIAEALAAYALGQCCDIILRIICPAEVMLYDVVSVSLDHADEPVRTVVQIVLGRGQRPTGDCPVCYRDGLHLNADKVSFPVIGVIEAYALVAGTIIETRGDAIIGMFQNQLSDEHRSSAIKEGMVVSLFKTAIVIKCKKI